MNKKIVLFALVPILTLGIIGGSFGIMKVLGKQADDIHPYNVSNVNIDYVDCGSESIPEERSFDDSTKYDYSNIDLQLKHGSYISNKGVYTSNEVNTLLVEDNIPFPYGSFSCDIKGTNNQSDDGIVFGLSDGGKASFWEDPNVYYYFFFLGHDGYIALGEVHNQNWSSLFESNVGSFDPNTTYSLKVIVKSNLIMLYLNNAMIFHFKDVNFLEGTKFGIRSGVSGVSFSNLHASSYYEYGD